MCIRDRPRASGVFRSSFRLSHAGWKIPNFGNAAHNSCHACNGAGILGLAGFEPVSYTHLDVYKRQHGGRLFYFYWRGITECNVPVSYTHLDVYKRQLEE